MAVHVIERVMDETESRPKTDEPPAQVSVEDGKKAIADLRKIGVKFAPNAALGGTEVDFGLIMGEFPNAKLSLLKGLPSVVPPVSIRLPEGVTDEGLTHVAGLQHLKMLGILGNNVTDAGLQQIGRIKTLMNVTIWSYKVTSVGIQQLQQALPDCEITHLSRR